MDDRKSGSIFVLISATGLGTLGVLGKLAYGAGLTIVSVLALRFIIGTIFFYVLLGLGNARRREMNLSRPYNVGTNHAFLCLKGRNLAVAVGLGAVGYATMSGLFFWGLKFMSAGMVAIVFYTYPMFVVVISTVVLKEKMTYYTTIALILTLVGVALITGFDVAYANLLGVLIVLLAALVFSTYVTVSRTLLGKVDAGVLTAYVLPSAAMTFLAYGIVTGQLILPATLYGWSLAIALGVIATAIPVFGFLIGLSRIGASRASILSTLEPVVAVLLGAAFLGDPVTSTTILGGALVLAGTVLIHKQ
jgi:drug/metabolite transporter (DMT)-like permease